MGIFDLFKKSTLQDELEMQQVIIHKQIQMIFEEMTSKADALEKLGRHQEAEQIYADAINKAQSIVNKAPKDYLYKLALGENVIKLGYLVDKKYFPHAEIIFNIIVKQHSDDKNADLTQTYWRLGLIQERLHNNTVNAINFYKLAMQSPKGNRMDNKQKNYDLSAVYLSMANILCTTDIDAAKSYARKRLNVVSDCPHAKAILDIRDEQPNVKFYLSDED